MAAKTTKKTAAKKTSSAKGAAKKASAQKPAAKRSAASTRKTAPKSRKEEPVRSVEQTNPAIYYEIFLWGMLAISTLLFISFLGFGGSIGKAINRLCFGCFGIVTYLLPFLFFFLTAFVISNRRSHIARVKAAGVGGLSLVACGIMQLLMMGYTESYDLREYFEAGAEYHTGGGLIGGLWVNLFCPTIGIVGAYIMLFIMAIICVVLITQRSIFADVKQSGTKVYYSAKEGQARRRERAKLRREEERNPQIFTFSDRKTIPVNYSVLPKEPRLSNRVTGVTENTDLSALPQVRSDEIKQVIPKKTEETINVPVMDLTIQRSDDSYYQTLEEKRPSKIRAKKNITQKVEILNTQAETEPQDMKTEEAFTDAPAEDVPKRASRKPHASETEIKEGIENVEQEIVKNSTAVKPEYVFPPMKLLKRPTGAQAGSSDAELRDTAQKLQQILHTFGVNVKVTNGSCGPSVTRYEMIPEMGVKVSKIVNLADDIKLNLAAADIRIEAPIPGKAAVGIEVPNKVSGGVLLRELLESDEFKNHPSDLAYAVGKDIAGKIIISDIAKMPHLLIAGATGSGKSVFINTLIMSIIYKASPEDVKMIMIDPKVVELSVYNGIPHLFIPVVTDPKKAAGALNWGVAEMMQRYEKFASVGVRDLKGYNAKVEKLKDIESEDKPVKLPQIVIIVDELADLMMVASGEVEDAIVRLTQLARAAGIYLVIATQRPSVDVITGLIKANMPSRIAFSVSSGVDSRTILDMNGAEKLLGNGDMLFAPKMFKKPARMQGAFVSDKEVADVVEFLKNENTTAEYNAQMEEQIAQVQKSALSAGGGGSDVDELFADAGRFIIEKDKASIGMLQRWFKIGFNRAARIMDQLSDANVVGPEEGTKPRKVLMSMEQFENYLEEN